MTRVGSPVVAPPFVSMPGKRCWRSHAHPFLSLNQGLRYCLAESAVRALASKPGQGNGVVISDRDIAASFKLPAGLDLTNGKR
jgi:hypothetical protein